MNYFHLILFWPVILWYIYVNSSRAKEVVTDNGYTRYQVSWWFAILAFVPIVCLVTLTPATGDVPMYLSTFKEVPTISGAIPYLSSLEKEWLFGVFQIIVKTIFGNNATAFRMCVALVQCVPIIYIFRKYSINYVLVIYLFLASANHIGWMGNGIRQFMAACIILCALPALEKKKYHIVIPIIIIAAGFHKTALLMLPIVFIVQGQAWNRKTMFFILASIIAIYSLTVFTGLFVDTLETTGYDSTLYEYDDGVNPLRVLVSFIPVILAFLGKDYTDNYDIPIVNILVNMSIVNFGIYLVGMFTSGILIGRIPGYTCLYTYLLLPYVIDKMYDDKTAHLLNILCILGYFVYYYVQYW